MRKAVALIRAYNDADQLLPIIDYCLKSRMVYFDIFSIHSNQDYDAHINYLKNKYSIRIKNIYQDIFYGFYKKIYKFRNILEGKKIFYTKFIFGDLLYYLSLRIVESILREPIKKYLKSLSSNDVIIMDAGSETTFPGKIFAKFAKINQINVNCFAHGYIIYTNLDNIEKGKITRKKIYLILRSLVKGKRIYANSYLTSPYQKDTYYKSSASESFEIKMLEKVYEIGAPRYTREWIKILRNEVYGGTSFEYGCEKKINVVLFISHFQYNVIANEFFSTFNKLSSLKNINFVYKPHTRGHLAGINESKLSGFNAYKIPSILLSEWADVGILYGSSIGYQLLLDQVPIIIPKYIHSNTTLYEKYKIATEVDSCTELIDILKKENFYLRNKLPTKNINKFVLNYIYNNMSNKKMMNMYIRQLGI